MCFGKLWGYGVDIISEDLEGEAPFTFECGKSVGKDVVELSDCAWRCLMH